MSGTVNVNYYSVLFKLNQQRQTSRKFQFTSEIILQNNTTETTQHHEINYERGQVTCSIDTSR